MNISFILEKNFNRPLTIGVFAGFFTLAASFFYYIYTTRLEKDRVYASHLYESLLHQTTAVNHDSVKKVALKITEKYPKTIYAVLSKLHLAKHAVEQDNLQEAAQLLMDVSKNTKDIDLQSIARQRGARVLSQMQHYEQALKMLDYPVSQEDMTTFEEIKGDILLTQGKKEEALQAYRAAKSYLTRDLEFLHPLLQIKLDNLDDVSNLNI